MTKVAIIGTGIAGLGCAHFLHRDFDLTLYEQDEWTGGHAHTVDVIEPGTGQGVPVDTGFMVFNRVTYPLLTRLFESLGVAIQPAPMSFSVRHAHRDLEFCGSSLNHLFAQRRNLVRPSFYRMLWAISRFNREAVEALDDPAVARMTLADYVRARRYGDDFFHLYLVPMSSAVWSAPPEKMLRFPAATLLRFFHNHGFLGLNTQHPWLTVRGGSRTYIEKLSSPWASRVRLGTPVGRLWRGPGGVEVRTRDGRTAFYDRVILACHADQALALLGDATPEEARLLSPFRYQPNVATLHTDARVMPRTRLAWSSWNYEIVDQGRGSVSTATHYWMNSLQGVSERQNYFVSVNRPEAIDPARILRRFRYDHPLFSLEAMEAQPQLAGLNAAAERSTETYFAGSYFRYGFHEDAFASAVALSERLLGGDPWRPAAMHPLKSPERSSV